MGKLEIIFRLRLAYPVLLYIGNQPPAIIRFPETGNTVRVDLPQYGPATSQPAMDGYEEMVVTVERECNDADGTNTSEQNWERLRARHDAAVAFWQVFESIRQSALSRNGTTFMYPVVPAQDIRLNPLVRRGTSEWFYNKESLFRVPFGPNNVYAIEITDEWWADTVKRFEEGRPVPAYRRFASDACYFAEHDPPRGIIMACAAWENALRYYLATVASRRDPAYLVASRATSVPRLLELAEAARGGPLLEDWIQNSSGIERFAFETRRNHMKELAKTRNKLLHKGEMDTPLHAMDFALAVMTAIDWLFEGN